MIRCKLGFHKLQYEYHLVRKGGAATCLRCGRSGLVDSYGILFTDKK